MSTKHRTTPAKRLLAPAPPADPWREYLRDEARMDALDAQAESRARRTNHRRELT